MKSLAVAPRHPALVAVAAALVAALPLAAPRPLAAQVAARIAGTAWRPGLDVPLSVLVKIGTAAATGRGVLGTVLRLPRRAPSGGTSSGSTSKRSKTPASTSSASSGAATAVRVLGTADHYVGTPYVFGGTTPEGFDCSGFVQYVYRKHGVSLPRTAAQQGGAGQKVHVALRDLRPGDLMLFDASAKRPGIDHVAMYVGNGRMIHSSASGGGVGYDELATKRGQWFLDHMVAARRVVANGQSLVDALASWAPMPLDPPDDGPSPSAGKR